MNVVTAESSPEGTAASRSQRPRRAQPTAGHSRCRLRRVSRLQPLRDRGRDGRGARPDRRDRARRRDGEKHDQHPVADRPDPALRTEPEARFDQHGIGEEGEQRAAVAERVEPVGITCGLALASRLEPAAQERRRRRQDERRQADHDEQDPNEIEDRGHGLHAQVGHPSRGNEQRQDRESRQHEVQRRPPDAQPGHRQMPVQVPDQQDSLEEEQHGRPDRGRPSEDRQDQPPDQRLHAEQEERRQPDRQREWEGGAKHGTCERSGAGGHRVSGRVDR